MSAGIYLPNGSYWSGAGWLFDLVVQVLARLVDDEAKRNLETVIATGVGVVDLVSFQPAAQQSVLTAIATHLTAAITTELSGTEGTDNEAALLHVLDLVSAANAGQTGEDAVE